MLNSGVIIGAVVLGILGATFIFSLVVVLILASARRKIWDSPWSAVMALSGVALLIGAIIAAIVWYPYDLGKYQTTQFRDGIIAETAFDSRADLYTRNDNRGGLRIRLGDGTVFYTTDFRLAGKTPGTPVSLVCNTGFQQGQGDRVDCVARIGSM